MPDCFWPCYRHCLYLSSVKEGGLPNQGLSIHPLSTPHICKKKKNMLEARVQREGRARERFYYIKPAFSEVGVN
jgi:hypothetical protein